MDLIMRMSHNISFMVGRFYKMVGTDKELDVEGEGRKGLK